MSNVDKRLSLMSQADKRYQGFVQETVDRISRMRTAQGRQLVVHNLDGRGKGAGIRRSAQVIDLNLKKTRDSEEHIHRNSPDFNYLYYPPTYMSSTAESKCKEESSPLQKLL